jgi:hypothetical protein
MDTSMNNFKIQTAYRLGQQAAMEKAAQDRGGLTYNPTYSQSDIDAIRRYNRDVASGSSNVAGSMYAAALPLSVGGYAYGKLHMEDNIRRALNGKNPVGFLSNPNAGKNLRSAAKTIGRAARAHPGRLGLGMLAAYGIGKGLNYVGKRIGQGVDNYVLTDVNSQDTRY